MKRLLATLALLCSGLLELPAAVQAQSLAPVNAKLKEAATLLPIDGIQDAITGLVAALQPDPGPSGAYVARTTIKLSTGVDLPLQLYFFGDADKQALLLVAHGQLALPTVFNNSGWKRLSASSFSDPIFSFSTVDFSLAVKDMPADFRQIVGNSYFNVPSLEFTNGFQLASRIALGGIMKTLMEVTMGVPTQPFTVRAGVALPFPTDAQSRAALAVSVATDMKNAKTMLKDAPEFFAELQLAPNQIVVNPLGMPSVNLADATFSTTNLSSVGFKGNALFQNGKKMPMFFETPLAPSGAADFVDFKFGLAASTLTLQDYVGISLAFYTNRIPGGSFIKDIGKYKDRLLAMAKPLSTFQLSNPQPVPEYRFGDKTKPFPPLAAFNILLLGPLASADDGSGHSVPGPLLKVVGNARALGQQVGSMNVIVGTSGLHGKVSQGLSLRLGPLGRQGISMAANADITDTQQSLGMHGNVLGRVLDVNMDGLNLSLNSPGTCATPFALTASMAIQSDMNVGSLLDGMPGVNVDPSQLANCTGADLTRALQWVTTTSNALGGYSASAANAVLNQQAADAAAAAAAAYKATKDAARNVAQNSASSSMQAFNDAGNYMKSAFGGKKKKSNSNKKFDRTVFNWDYYYDRYPDLVAQNVDLVAHWDCCGFQEGRQGSNEFLMSFYRTDPRSTVDNMLNYWLGDGINQGQQGSPGFSVKALLNRYPDLKAAFGGDYRSMMNWWLDQGGLDSGRDGRP